MDETTNDFIVYGVYGVYDLKTNTMTSRPTLKALYAKLDEAITSIPEYARKREREPRPGTGCVRDYTYYIIKEFTVKN